jgi:DNA-binding GntR family transcriptional regulator
MAGTSAAAGRPSPPPTRGPAVTPQREAVVTHVRRAVVQGALRPGDKLREVRLAAELEVSRPTLREALNLLVQDGLLVQEPYRGFSVARLEPAAVRDLAHTRVPLDLIAVDGILADDADRRLQLVRDAWEVFERRALDPDPLVQHEAHIALHYGLWVASENSTLLKLWPVVEALTTIALAQEQAVRADPQRAYTLHREGVQAVLSRDRARIEDWLVRHTVASTEEFLETQA